MKRNHLLSLLVLPNVAISAPVIADSSGSSDIGLSAVLLIFLVLVLIALFALSKAADSLADRVRDTMRPGDH